MMRQKILYIHHGKGIGGAPLSLLYLIKNIDQKKFLPIVLFLHDSEAMTLFKKEGVVVYGPVNRYDLPHSKIRWFAWYHPHHILRSLIDSIIVYIKTAPYWLKLLRPDIVHLNTSSLSVWAAVAKKLNIPVVNHVREPLSSGYFGLRKRMLAKRVGASASVIVPICKNDGRPWKQSGKNFLVYNAAPQDRFSDAAIKGSPQDLKQQDQRRQKILYLGGISREKGTKLLLESFNILVKKFLPEVQLLIAGYWEVPQYSRFYYRRYSPSYRFAHECNHLASELGDSVTLLGRILDVPAAMANADVIIFPATVGHFARPIIEAGFMRRAVVASHLSPLDELVVNDLTGKLIAGSDPWHWADELAGLLKEPGRLKSMGEEGYRLSTRLFEVGKQVEQMSIIYESLPQGRASGY